MGGGYQTKRKPRVNLSSPDRLRQKSENAFKHRKMSFTNFTQISVYFCITVYGKIVICEIKYL